MHNYLITVFKKGKCSILPVLFLILLSIIASLLFSYDFANSGNGNGNGNGNGSETAVHTGSVFLTAAGAAFGGFLGVVAFFLLRFYIEWVRSKPAHVRTYLFGNSLNQGQEDETEGELLHHHGRRVTDQNELNELDAKNPLWEWTKEPVGRNSGAAVVYGPYATDFTEPGLYSAAFIIRGIGFTKPSEITKDVILLELDVNKSISKYTTFEDKLAAYAAQYKIARRFVRVSEIAVGGWQSFELKFYSDGQGLWEYRVFAYDGLYNKADNIGRFGSEVRILLDKVIINKVRQFSLPWP